MKKIGLLIYTFNLLTRKLFCSRDIYSIFIYICIGNWDIVTRWYLKTNKNRLFLFMYKWYLCKKYVKTKYPKKAVTVIFRKSCLCVDCVFSINAYPHDFTYIKIIFSLYISTTAHWLCVICILIQPPISQLLTTMNENQNKCLRSISFIVTHISHKN